MKLMRIMRKVYDINDFANECGYFYNAYLKNDVDVNNGYNCSHPDCEEKVDGVGCCFAWGCPLGYEADQDDLDNQEIDNNGFTECEEGQLIIQNTQVNLDEPKR